MCGIVAYFGSAPNSLTRLITGMSAIIYRAPDSTGVGTFGGLTQGVSMRKAVGSVSNLVECLGRDPLNQNSEQPLLDLWKSPGLTGRRMQKKLITFEGLSLDAFNASGTPYLQISDLVLEDSQTPSSIQPGHPGDPEPEREFCVHSKIDLQTAVRTMVFEFDLSFVAIKALFRDQLCRNLEKGADREFLLTWKTDILNAFDHLFAQVFEKYRPVKPVREEERRIHINPDARTHLWGFLAQCPVRLPRDFCTDGVACIFNRLDQAALSRIKWIPQMEARLQQLLDRSFGASDMTCPCAWRSLYLAERGVNVFGRAAGAVVAWLGQNGLGIEAGGLGIQRKPSFAIHGKWLKLMSQPVIAHGRWALQSGVSVENAHPFQDERGERCVVLNGQFSSEVEDELSEYLNSVARFTFRSGNSSEFFPLLWGYYFDVLTQQKKRFQQVKDLTRNHLEAYSVGSSSISYRRLQQVEGKSDRELDEQAFVETVRRFIRDGGQIAVAGISTRSPTTLYVAACNRPAFIVERRETNAYMVVSDINAALGLFPQSLIKRVTREYEHLVQLMDKEIRELSQKSFDRQGIRRIRAHFSRQINQTLSAFQVDVVTLEGEEIFARLDLSDGGIPSRRQLVIKDLNDNMLHDLDMETLNLTPPHVHRHMDKSFFESHLDEVPDLLEAIVRSALTPELSVEPFDIDTNRLKKRFGRGLKSLRRIFIAGMGTSYHVSRFAAGLARILMPQVEILCIQPVEADLPPNLLSSDSDLVLLVSWSATTADMVKLSKQLLAENILFAGFTEKVFADMGLLSRKSLGSIHMMSGEEVTIPGVKSPFCSLLTLDLFMLWLAGELRDSPPDPLVAGALRQLPWVVRQLAGDGQLHDAAKGLARSCAGAKILFIVDALCTGGPGYEAALKMEEMTWSLNTMAVDYSDFDPVSLKGFGPEHRVIITATRPDRGDQALGLMKDCRDRGILFFALACEDLNRERIDGHASGNAFFLPVLPQGLEPFSELVFFYWLAFYTAMARGRNPDDYPRNRAKSVTTSRSPLPSVQSPKKEIYLIQQKDSQAPGMVSGPKVREAPFAWETHKGFSSTAAAYFVQIKKLGRLLSKPDLVHSLVSCKSQVWQRFSHLLFEPRKGKELLFYCLDREAQAAARNTVDCLGRILPCRIRVLDRMAPVEFLDEDAVLMVVSGGRFSDEIQLPDQADTLWLGPEIPGQQYTLGGFLLKDTGLKGLTDLVLYTALVLILVNAWKFRAKEGAGALETHFLRSRQAIFAGLDDPGLAEAVQRTMARNKGYQSMLFISPFKGIAGSGARLLGAGGIRLVKPVPCGTGAHGPLATVDNGAGDKYVRLESESRMVRQYGRQQLDAWLSTYLPQISIDDFLGYQAQAGSDPWYERPFFVKGHWYLPVLRPGYPFSEDTLILIDAASERYLNLAADELAVFGCRHARMIIITQQALVKQGKEKMLRRFPLTGIWNLPCLPGKSKPVALSDMHLPYIMNLISAAAGGIP